MRSLVSQPPTLEELFLGYYGDASGEAEAGAAGAVSAYAGTGALVRLALRRSRIMLAVWVVVFVVFAAYSATATVDLYPSPASRIAAADTINSSQALVAMYGRVYDPSSLGASR